VVLLLVCFVLVLLLSCFVLGDVGVFGVGLV